MVFNSISYLFFFTAVIAIYFLTANKLRWIVVLVSSYFFYMSWKPEYGVLLLTTTFIDWSLALWMNKYSAGGPKRAILVASLAANLAILSFFKYFNFISVSLWDIFKFENGPVLLNLILPIGISFYTFQSMAYMIDVYRVVLMPEKNFFRYAAFVSFFPHLVSGPILRPANIIPQLHEKKEWRVDNFKRGMFLIGTGLIKKVVIADNLSFLVNRIYNSPDIFSGAAYLFATYFFAIQIYCDFCGYTDIAIGSAKILGYDIPDNFMQPYFSKNIQEFWRRWHISLSSWFRDYLYIPLGGNRGGNIRTYFNLMITMLLCGLWHGANWTFVFWGFLQGMFMGVSRATMNIRDTFFSRMRTIARFRDFWKIFLTFNIMSFSWIFFRAKSMGEALNIIRAIFTDFTGNSQTHFAFTYWELFWALSLIAILVVFDVAESHKKFSSLITNLSWPWQAVFVYVVVLVLITFGVPQGPQFIYFQF